MTTNSWYRRSLFNYKGNREYTRTGYEAASVRFVAEDLEVDCSDKHFMITGSNSGIGLQTALEVARRGGVIHMVCRNRDAATKARSEIITTTGNDKIHLHIVDLSKPREVIAWAQRFAAQHERLDVLVHNAGCMVHERRVDEDGVECNFAVNTLAVHILTITFMPLLQRSEEPRMVMVSSAGLLCVRLDPHDLMHANMEPFAGNLVYSQNKRQQVVMTLWYAQHYNKFYEMMKDNLRTPAQGADTVVWLAISKAALKHPSGLFFQDREPVSTHFPLAWTKSSIEEEDILINNIQEVYSQIYNKVMAGASISSPSTEAPPPEPEPQATEDNKGPESAEKTLPHPLATESEPAEFPVLPPPPPPAEKVVPVKSEVQVAEVHSPPASSHPEDTSKDASKGASKNPFEDPSEDEDGSEDDTNEKDKSEDARPTPAMQEKTEPAVDNTKVDETKETKETKDFEPIPSPLERTDATVEVKTPADGKKEDLQDGDGDDDSSSASIEQVIPEP
ncbi:hypothetical protein O3P69_011102 [Scylla paramamosain]|uniref:Dehydrogenase/reductase SDR family member 12 n=1 Tax=Scylla paramamosain TaxID=85552 RepID=A0AAW0SUB2_SCYPA